MVNVAFGGMWCLVDIVFDECDARWDVVFDGV